MKNAERLADLVYPELVKAGLSAEAANRILHRAIDRLKCTCIDKGDISFDAVESCKVPEHRGNHDT